MNISSNSFKILEGFPSAHVMGADNLIAMSSRMKQTWFFFFLYSQYQFYNFNSRSHTANTLSDEAIMTHIIQCRRLVYYKSSKVEGVTTLFPCITLSMWGCQYSSCWVFATVLLILEKKVGLVRYIRVGSKPNVSAITVWIRPRTSLNGEKQMQSVR